MKRIYATTAEQMQSIADELRDMAVPEFGVHITIETGQRTSKQNNSIHKYFELLGDALNDAGLDMRRTMKADVDIPWNANTVKEFLWRPIQRVVMGADSTTKLNTKQVSEVYEVLTRHMAEKHGVSVPFPQSRYPE